jgi:acetyl-CoA carboxylase carboxyltransferase component/biotin carboxyl carrier protein
VQRRHQKVLEEAPPSGVSEALTEILESAAVRIAREVSYSGVGTVEFLVAGDEFWFLEVNPRLQVEHGITEERLGLDLVELQIRIARGERMPAIPEPAPIFAIEARVCAEDPEADFLPAPGEIARFDPALGPRVRIDSGIAAGCRIPSEFDSLIAKVIATGPSREAARARLVAALSDFDLVVRGGATNKGYLIDLLESEAYRDVEVDTQWIDRTPELRLGSLEYAIPALVAAAILSYQRSRDTARRAFFRDAGDLAPSSIPASTGQRVDLTFRGQGLELRVFGVGAWRYRVHLDGRAVGATLHSSEEHVASLEIGTRTYRVLHDVTETGLRIEIEGHPYRFGSELAGQVRAGTPAMVIGLQIAVGDSVEAGQQLGLLEAMKMEIGFQAPVSGVVKAISVRAGQQVAAGDLLLVIEANADGEATGESAPLQLPDDPDPLDLFLDTTAAGDLLAASRARDAEQRAAFAAVREEIRRIVMGYDVNPDRVEKLSAFLAAPLPDGLGERFCQDLAEIRNELILFADLEELFVRAPHDMVSGETGPSNYARLRMVVRRLSARGGGVAEEFLDLVRRALAHYGIEDLEPTDAMQRAVLRLLASQRSPQLRHRLVQNIVHRLEELATRGVALADDAAVRDALSRIASMRGLLADPLADAATLARYSIFEAPVLEQQAERTSKEVEGWLDAAESELRPPPKGVLVHIADAPKAIFDRVGRWITHSDPRRRAIAVAAYIRRLYAPGVVGEHTSGSVASVQIERLDLPDGRIVLGGAGVLEELPRILSRLSKAAGAAASSEGLARAHAIEILVPGDAPTDLKPVARDLKAGLRDGGELGADRLTLSFVPNGGVATHRTLIEVDGALAEREGLHGLHPEAATRIDLQRLRNFDLEPLAGPDDLYGFHLRSRDVPGDERLVVLAEVRGRSPDAGNAMDLHIPAFERTFFEATRALRNWLALRDPRRRLQWNRIAIFVAPPIVLDPELVSRLAGRLASATRHLGLEKVVVRLRVVQRGEAERAPEEVEIVIGDPTGGQMEISSRPVHQAPLLPIQDYERNVVAARRRRLVYPYEIIRMLTGGDGGGGEWSADLPSGTFEEYDLAPDTREPKAIPVERPPGQNRAAVVFGLIRTPTDKVPEGMERVLVLSDPTRGMGALAAPECDRLVAAINLAEHRAIPIEWLPVSSGAKIAMDSGTENLDATARVVRRIVTFTTDGGTIHLIVHGVNVGAQSYFDALATMLQHTRGVLIMTPGASMVLTGRAALEASGSVSAEDEAAIGGFERVMGPNGQAQYFARDLVDAYHLLYDHYRYDYVVPGEAGPRRLETSDPASRDCTEAPYQAEGGHDFERVGDIFDNESNPGRKRPFAMRSVMQAVIDADGGHLERWRNWAGAETSIVWDAHLGGIPVTLIGIESQNLDRLGYLPNDGPSSWTGGTLFPLSSKKISRALNAASGNRPAVILANLSGFDGSPESMRKLQLEYGAEIARAVVNFEGPLSFLVVSRYHGGAYVVFSRALNPNLEAYALSGSYASVIGGGPAATVVFAREVQARAAADARASRARAPGVDPGAWQEIALEKQAEIAAEFDSVHTVERALHVGSLDSIVAPEAMRAHLIEALSKALR